jgi:HEPN domain-containing protein
MKTHDLDYLLDRVSAGNVAVPEEFSALVSLTPFAVDYRYEFSEPEKPLERSRMWAILGDLHRWAESIIRSEEGGTAT